MSLFHNNPTHERRVRQIYDSLDSGNPKKAIQEADKLLKKQKDALDAKALKALAYIRLCKFKECADILADLERDQPTDDSTLHALSLCFRELNKPEDLARIFENATQKCPHVEELWTNLYFAYMRTENYQNQHKTALTLYKGCQKQIYLNWAVMSLVFQALRNPEKAKVIYLPLAEKMMTKSTPTEKSLSETEMDLLSIILEMSGKWEEATKLFLSPAGSKIRYGDVPAKEKIAQIYHKMENYDMASHCYQELIKEQPDNWNLYQKYLDTLLHIPDTDTFKDYLGSFKHKKSLVQKHRTLLKYGHQREDGDGRLGSLNSFDFDIMRHVQLALDFVDGIISWLESHGKKGHRGPYMAKFDLYVRLLTIGLDLPPTLGDLSALVEKYVKIFGSKPCCFWDLEYFLCVPKFREALNLDRLLETHMPKVSAYIAPENQEHQPTLTPEAYGAMKKRDGVVFTVFKLGKYTGFFDGPRMSRREKFRISSGFVTCYFTRDSVTLLTTTTTNNSLNEGGKGSGGSGGGGHLKDKINGPHEISTIATPRTNGPRIPSSDHHTFYASMASDLLFDLWRQTGIFDYLRQALILLEHTINRYPDCVQIRFALIKIYFLIGASALCIEHFHKIDVKFIQYDTLGNFLMYPLFAYSHFGPLKTCFENIIKFYENSYKNIWDYCVTVVKVNFFQIYDFMDFKHHLTYSILRNFITIESVILDLLTEASSIEIAEEIIDSIPLKTLQDFNQEELCDNTDYFAIESYESNQKLDYEKFVEENYQQEKYWVGVRNRILHTLSISVLLGCKRHYSPLCSSPQSRLNHECCDSNCPNNAEYYDKDRLLASLRSTYHSILVQKDKWSTQFYHKAGDGGPLVTNKYRLYGPFTSQLPIYLSHEGVYLEILLDAIRLVITINYSLVSPHPPTVDIDSHQNLYKAYCENVKIHFRDILDRLKDVQIPIANISNGDMCYGFPSYATARGKPDTGEEFRKGVESDTADGEAKRCRGVREQNFVIAASSKMYHIRFACETLGLLTLYVGSLHQLLKPLKLHANKKGKKKIVSSGATNTHTSNGPLRHPNSTNPKKEEQRNTVKESVYLVENVEKINQTFDDIQNLLIYLHQTVRPELETLMEELAANLETHITLQSSILLDAGNKRFNSDNANSSSLSHQIGDLTLKAGDESITEEPLLSFGSVFSDENFNAIDVPKDLFTKILSSYEKTFSELAKMLSTGAQYINSLKLL